MAWSSLRHRTVPATAAAGLLGACAFVAFAVAPAAVSPTPAAADWARTEGRKALDALLRS